MLAAIAFYGRTFYDRTKGKVDDMITGYDGEKLTPKAKAQQLMMESVSDAIYRLYREREHGEMTGRETAKVEEQMTKLRDRIGKMLGYVEVYWS